MRNNVSVIVSTYANSARLSVLEDILQAWLAQTPHVFLADCSNGKFETSLPITHVRFNRDVGNKTRHALALLTETKFVIKSDDDLLPKDGLINDLYQGWQKAEGGIVGILGRKFTDPVYIRCPSIRANEIDKPIKVGFVGITTFSPRDYLAFDLRGCFNPIEDLFWQCKCYPDISKHVVPTKAFELLPEAGTGKTLFQSISAQEMRQGFYKIIYNSA